MKKNKLLLQHVTIPGYNYAFCHRDNMRGSGVGVYVKDTIVFKRRKDIENRHPELQHICGLRFLAEIKTEKVYSVPFTGQNVRCLFLTGYTFSNTYLVKF